MVIGLQFATLFAKNGPPQLIGSTTKIVEKCGKIIVVQKLSRRTENLGRQKNNVQNNAGFMYMLECGAAVFLSICNGFSHNFICPGGRAYSGTSEISLSGYRILPVS